MSLIVWNGIGGADGSGDLLAIIEGVAEGVWDLEAIGAGVTEGVCEITLYRKKKRKRKNRYKKLVKKIRWQSK